jgi:hypothetical protein
MRGMLLALLSLALTSTGHAQKVPLSRSAIEVAGVRLRLGMAKAQVAEKLAGVVLTKVNDDEWMIGSFEKGNIGPSIQFHNGVLSYAERFWTTADNDVADALFGVVTTLNDEGFSNCTVTADTHTSPDINAQRVWIACGEKSVLIIKRLIGGHSYNSVYEQLGKRRSVDE